VVRAVSSVAAEEDGGAGIVGGAAGRREAVADEREQGAVAEIGESPVVTARVGVGGGGEEVDGLF